MASNAKRAVMEGNPRLMALLLVLIENSGR